MSTVKTEWDLKLFYESQDDPRIERDLRAIERAYARFEKTYRKKSFTKTAPLLLKALGDFTKLLESVSSMRPILYFHYRRELDAKDVAAEAKLHLFEERLTKASNKVTFFELTLGKIPLRLQRRYLAHQKLAPYRHYLTRVFLSSRHNLAEVEERLLALLSGPSSGMWVSGVDKAISSRTVEWGGETIPLNEALMKVTHLEKPTDREILWGRSLDALEGVLEFAESEINALFLKKKTLDELRGFKEAHDATVLHYQNDPKAVAALTTAVTAAFPIAHRFYALKKRLLGLAVLRYEDRSAPLASTVAPLEFPFERAAEEVRAGFEALDSQYAAVLTDFLKHGQIDVLPKKGKSGGAFCSSSHGNPTFVLLNHTGEFNSVLTLAHEMGHAIHSERSRATQGVLYEDYSMSVAETASTFFEGAVFARMTERFEGKARIVALHDRIQDDIATVFRQIACFNFEKALHAEVRASGWVPKERIAALLNAHMQAYLGPSVTLGVRDGHFFAAWGHLRRPFYVYSYAYGLLISKALLARVHRDRRFIGQVDAFLRAGGSDTPEAIFKQIGINVTKPAFWKEGLASIERDVDQLERLVTEAGHSGILNT